MIIDLNLSLQLELCFSVQYVVGIKVQTNYSKRGHVTVSCSDLGQQWLTVKVIDRFISK